jgi:hypothetical protein
MRPMRLLVLECEFEDIFIVIHWNITNKCSLLFGVLYWYIWTVLLPRWGHYKLEEEKEILADGTSITKLVRVYGG